MKRITASFFQPTDSLCEEMERLEVSRDTPRRTFLGGRASGGATNIQDLYETPSSATEALLDFFPILREGVTVFEPCAGNSAISDVLIGRGLYVIERDLYTMDRDGNHVPNPENVPIGHDFLVDEPPAEFDCIITNPPYCSVSIY
jgi:hypothetical protein